MISLSDRLDNIEADLSLVDLQYKKAFKDGTILTDEDELKAVRDNIFGRIREIEQRINIIKRQLKSLTNIIYSAK